MEDFDDNNLPPPSQSHFAKFENFTPNNAASFEDEFARLASSQEWVPGSQEYTKERTIAMREELKQHYFPSLTEELTTEEKLKGYQDLCHEVGIAPSESIGKCKKELKNTLVNIVDLIDARRTLKEVKVWNDFNAFRNYTLQDEHRIDREEAKKDGGHLAALLQQLGGGGGRRSGARGSGTRRDGFRVNKSRR